MSLYNINCLVFVTETECVYCAVRTGYLNKIQVTISLWVNLADEFRSGLITVVKEGLQVQHNPRFNYDKKNDRKKDNDRERRQTTL